jgi:tetratricopeptide (TPR) repeat protein
MQVLRAAGQFEEEISLAEETFAVINSHPEAMPEERLMANVKDDLGEIYDMLGRTHEAVPVMKEAGLIFANLLESDSENENYMRSYVINQVRTAKVLALKVGNTAEARQNLDETEKIVTKLRQMMPNSLKVRDIAMEYFITRAQVEIADNEMETAKENWSMVIGNLYNGITKNQRAVDIPLFVNFLVRLFRTAIDTGHLELANEFVSVEIQAKKEFMDLRLITLENADMDSTMDRYDLVENLKNNN